MKLARLPGTATELTAIWNALGKPKESLFLAGQATETRVRSTTLDADVISFATHGLLAGEINGMSEPGLIMTPPTQPTSSDDGYLSSSEIAELTISSQWVILSACNTETARMEKDSQVLPNRSFLQVLHRCWFPTGP